MRAPQSSPSNQVAVGISAAPVCTASAATAEIRAFSPNISTSTPLSFRSRSLTRQTRPPRAQPLGQGAERAAAAGQREDLEAQALPEPQEALVDRLGPQPLGDGGELPGPAADDPGAGLLEVAHVRQRDDHAAAGLQVGEQRRLVRALEAHPGHQPLGGGHRQPEDLEPVPGVGQQRGPGQRAQFLAVHLVRCRTSSSAPGAGWPRVPGPRAPGGARRCQPPWRRPTTPRPAGRGRSASSPAGTRPPSAAR